MWAIFGHERFFETYLTLGNRSVVDRVFDFLKIRAWITDFRVCQCNP